MITKRTLIATFAFTASLLALLIFSSPDAIAQKGKAAKAALNACKPDIAKLCGQVQPGGGRIKGCMKEHLPELGEPCKEALFQAWLRN
jgi:hypothetical protein